MEIGIVSGTVPLLDEQMTKIKVIDLDQFYNFVVDDFFI